MVSTNLSQSSSTADDPARPQPPSLTTQASWLLATQVLAFALTLALPILLVRLLTQFDFGLYRQIFFAVAAAVAMLPLGFQMSAFHFLVREPGARQSIALHVVLVHAVIGALACVALHIWPGMLALLFGTPELTAYAPSVGWILFLWITAAPLEMLPVADQDVRRSTLFIVFAQMSKTLLFVVGALFGSVSGLINAAILQGLIQCGILLFYLHSRFDRPWRRFDRAVLRQQIDYATPLGLAGLLGRAQTDVHHYFVSHAFGPSGYAIYSTGVFNLPFVSMVRDSVGSVMIPRISQLEHRGDHREIVALFARVARRLAVLFFPSYVYLVVVGREFIELLFTKQYLDSWPVFLVNLTLVPLGVLMVDPITRAFPQQRLFVLRLRAVILTALIIVLAFGTTRLGLVGTIAAIVAANMIAVAATLPRLARLLHVRRGDLAQFADVGRIALAAIAAGIVSALVRRAIVDLGPVAVLAGCALVFVPVYFGAVMLLARSVLPAPTASPQNWRMTARYLLTGSMS